MKTTPLPHVYLLFILLTGCLALTACQSIDSPALAQTDVLTLVKHFPTSTNPSVSFNASIIASPVLDNSHTPARLIIPVSDGTIAALDADSGALIWQLNAPIPVGQQAELIATPVVIDDKLVVSYQIISKGVRSDHRLAVIDLRTAQWDARFPVLSFAAERPASDGKSTVKFNPPTTFSHAALKHIAWQGSTDGLIYAAFGNAGDIQPFHGWLFEVDMDAWQRQGNSHAIRNVLLTTPEADCPSKTEFGTQEMVCGGGIWVPNGPLISQSAQHTELFIPTGNGQVDLNRQDYANALMRVTPGLQFTDGCDRQLCANFDPTQPNVACINSCKNLFIPRLASDHDGFKPPNHECDNKSFWECLAWMDYDLGGNTPIKVTLKSGRNVLVQAGKDGGAYLIDAEHLGKQYDRLQIAQLCGSATDLCRLSWAGMIVTDPVQTTIDDEAVVIIPTFNTDQSHPAGLVALKILEINGQPQFQRFWQFPSPNQPEAIKWFRSHPSLPVLSTHLGHQPEPVVWIVDIGTQGKLFGIRAKDGQVLAKQDLQGTGRQLSMPLIVGNQLYLASNMPQTGKAILEAYRIETSQALDN